MIDQLIESHITKLNNRYDQLRGIIKRDVPRVIDKWWGGDPIIYIPSFRGWLDITPQRYRICHTTYVTALRNEPHPLCYYHDPESIVKNLHDFQGIIALTDAKNLIIRMNVDGLRINIDLNHNLDLGESWYDLGMDITKRVDQMVREFSYYD